MTLNDIKGHCVAKRALEVAAVGNHRIMLYGPRGAGKSALIKAHPHLAGLAIERDSCLCGNHQSTTKECTCSERALYRWLRRVKRTAETCDLVVEVPHRTTRELLADKPKHFNGAPYDEAEMSAKRIAAAQAFGETHTSLDISDDATYRTMEMAARRLSLDYRAVESIKRVARSIANLDGSERLKAKHVAEAVQYQYFAYQR